MSEPHASLILVRHGQIAANVARIWHGSTDSPLTPHGEGEALRVASELARRSRRPSALYASPLLRARQTANAISSALALETRIDPGLAEYGIGALEGSSYEDLIGGLGFFAKIAKDLDFAPSGGESTRQVALRTSEALERIARSHPDETAIVVGHGAALAIGIAYLIHGDPLRWQQYHLSNCSISTVSLAPSRVLHSWNDIAHL